MLLTPSQSAAAGQTSIHEPVLATLSRQGKRFWVADVIALVFILAFLFWFEVVLQDWLLSPLEPYPYAASALNGLGVLAGLICFLRARRLILWRNIALCGATLVVAVEALGFVSYQGSLISLGALVCGLTTPPLLLSFVDKKKFQRHHFLCLSAFFIAAMALIYRTYASQNLVWGVLVILMATGTGALGVFIARGRQLLRRASSPNPAKLWFPLAVGSFLLFGALLALAGSTIWPVNLPATTNLWQGEGFGGNSFPVYWPGASSLAPVIAQEQGVFALWILVLLFGAALSAGALVLSKAAPDADDAEAVEEWQTSVELGCGALGALGGMLLGARLGPPFLTIDSVGGTWALSLALASLGIAAAPRRKPSGAARSVLQKAESSGVKKRSFFVVGSVAALIFIGAAVYWNTLREAVQPFAENGPVSGVASYVPLSNISLAMQDATVAMEDGNFYQHHGMEWASMHRALRVNMREGRVRQGGSTITQQLAKNLFLSEERTIARKIKEAALTLELERQLSKQRILEIYLNVIDYGMKQHGISAAAHYYFHKAPSQMTLAESAMLVGLVPKPPQEKLVSQEIAAGREKALQRMAGVWPQRYSSEQMDKAMSVSIYHLVYPFKTVWDRGATEEIPAQWHGINFYYAPTTDVEAKPIYNVAPGLKPPLAAFLKEAHNRFKVVGISHVGVYDDRPVRGSDTVMSSHAFGQALDIAGFHFADGSQVRVKDHRNPRVAARLLPLGALLRQHFDVVVDWRDDPQRHDDHFHAEIKGKRDSAPRDAT